MHTPDVLILMGPSGCGKSTIGRALEQRSGWPFIEGDDHHPQANRDKMASRIPLTDRDRAAWISALVAAINSAEGPRIIASCSALTPYVQERLRNECQRAVRFILLAVSERSLKDRLHARESHFMPPALLASQMAALVVPKGAIVIDADQDVGAITEAICAHLSEHSPEHLPEKGHHQDQGKPRPANQS